MNTNEILQVEPTITVDVYLADSDVPAVQYADAVFHYRNPNAVEWLEVRVAVEVELSDNGIIILDIDTDSDARYINTYGVLDLVELHQDDPINYRTLGCSDEVSDLVDLAFATSDFQSLRELDYQVEYL